MGIKRGWDTPTLPALNNDLLSPLSFSLWLSRFVCVCVWRVCACSRPPVRSDLASAAQWEPAVRKRPELSGPSAGRPRQKQSYQLCPPAGHTQPWKHVQWGQRWVVHAVLTDVLHSWNCGLKSVIKHWTLNIRFLFYFIFLLKWHFKITLFIYLYFFNHIIIYYHIIVNSY